MKKLLFGLLLTVGISGFSFGNTIIEKEEVVKDENIFFGCYHQTITIYRDSCGRTTTVNSPMVSVPCLSTEPNDSYSYCKCSFDISLPN